MPVRNVFILNWPFADPRIDPYMWIPDFSFNIRPLMPKKEISPSEKERRKKLPPEARRALEEADARQAAQAAKEQTPEIGGPAGEEPTRYGDWERKGRAVDF